MHECPFCGQMCDCDGEDIFMNVFPDDHWCSCMEEEEEEDDDEYTYKIKLEQEDDTVAP